MPDPLNGKVLNAFEARQYWKGVQKVWVQAAKDIRDEIAAIPDEALRKAVAGIVHALGERKGHFGLSPAPEGFHISTVELDDGAYDPLEADVGEEKLAEASNWIVNCVQALPAVFVGWAFGELHVNVEEFNLPPDTKLWAFEWERIAYSVEEHRILGVQTHPKNWDPKNRFIEVKLYPEG